MKNAEPQGKVHPEQLLELWMGEAEERGRRRRRLPPAPVLAVLTLLGALALALMLKFAIDVLAIVVALVGVGVALHILEIRLAESELLSPGWLLIIIVAGALVAYALFVPADSVAALNRYMPRWAVAALEWSENKGWGQRVLVGPGDSTASSGSTSPMVATSGPASQPATGGSNGSGSTAASPSVILTASSPSSLQGQPVTLMARLAVGEAGGQTSVRFYDGLMPLGTADLKAEGRTRIAYLTVRGLAVGEHEIRAEVVGPLGVGVGYSAPLRHAVLRRAR